MVIVFFFELRFIVMINGDIVFYLIKVFVGDFVSLKCIFFCIWFLKLVNVVICFLRDFLYFIWDVDMLVLFFIFKIGFSYLVICGILLYNIM